MEANTEQEISSNTTASVEIAGVPTTIKKSSIPPQQSASDTSNWDNREFYAPNGKVLVETNQKKPKDREVIAE